MTIRSVGVGPGLLVCLRPLSLRLPDDVHAPAQRLAEQDGLSLNEWLVAAIEREAVRRGLEALNEWAKVNPGHPSLDLARHGAIEAENADAVAKWKSRGAA